MPTESQNNQHIIDTNFTTLVRFILNAQVKFKSATGQFTQLLISIQTACKAISNAVRRAGIGKIYGQSGSINSSGDNQQKLDVISNNLFINGVANSYSSCILVSEEEEEYICIPTKMQGHYIVMFDPLDGSSNIECLVSIGSIFGIFERTPGDLDEKQLLRSGRNLVAAGYVLYGNATMMVLAMQGVGVNGFTLDPSIGEFILTNPNMKIKESGYIYSVNEAYSHQFNHSIYKFIEDMKNTKKNCSSRYIGSMVADVHRTIMYGGIFMYPGTEKNPDGKLRLLYEANPMSFIVEMAGGKATDLKKDILDIVPTSIHSTTPVFLGSSKDIDALMAACSEKN